MPDLMSIYYASEYVVSPVGEPPLVVRHGALHPKLDAFLARAHPGESAWVIMTAWNPFSTLTEPTENALRQAQLVVELRARGCATHPAFGRAPASEPPWAEDSLLVVGVDEEAALELGRRYEQSAVVVGRVGAEARVVAC